MQKTASTDELPKASVETSKETKMFALTDNINNVDLKVLMGIPLRETDGESPSSIGAMMGSGGIIVMDEDSCMVETTKLYMGLITETSCGKCTHCRVGTKRMLEILTRIVDSEGKEGDIEALEQLGSEIKDGSLCGLGQTAPNPVLTALHYFKNEYIDHIINHKCTAKQCKKFIRYEIDAKACTGCGLCKKDCPTNAIAGEKKKPHVVSAADCIACKKCKNVCKFNAVTVRDREWKQ